MQQQLKHAAEPLSLNIGSFYKPILPVKEMKDCQLELLCLAAICQSSIDECSKGSKLWAHDHSLVIFVTFSD